VILLTGLFPKEEACNKRGYRTACSDSASGLVLRLSGMKKEQSARFLCSKKSKKRALCRQSQFSGFRRVMDRYRFKEMGA